MTPTIEGLQKRVDELEENNRSDGWQNLLNGRGTTAADPKLATTFQAPMKLIEKDLANLYNGNGFAKRIVDLPAREMTREWFTIEGDPENLIIQHLETFHARKRITQMLKWSRLFGGAVGIMGIDDNGELEETVDEGNIRSVEFIHVFDRFRVSFSSGDLYTDPKDKKFGTPEIYTIQPKTGLQFKVHETRVLVLNGLDTPSLTTARNQGWGDSVLLAMWSQLRNLGVSYHAVADIMNSFETIIVSLDNLQQLVASGKEDVVKKRLELMDLSRATLNVILLDAKEKFDRKSSSVAGLDKLLTAQTIALSAVSGIPATLLLGQSPRGMNATGESDIRQWYDNVASDQEDILQSLLERLILLSMLAKEGPTKGKELDSWSVKFRPLWQPTEKEIAETRKLIAESDEIYLNGQVLHPTEIRTSRFGGETYSIDTTIDEAFTRKPGEPTGREGNE